MYGYIVTTFKHIEDLKQRTEVQAKILNYVQNVSKSSKKLIVEEHGEFNDNPHWNIFLEHKTPAHLLDIFKSYYPEGYYTRGLTVTTRRVKGDIDASFIINGYLTKEKNAKIIYNTLTDSYINELNKLYEMHTHKVTPKEKVIKRFCRLTDCEFINVLYDAFYPMYEKTLAEGSDFEITTYEFIRVVKDIMRDYNIQQHLNKLNTFFIQLKGTYGILQDQEISDLLHRIIF